MAEMNSCALQSSDGLRFQPTHVAEGLAQRTCPGLCYRTEPPGPRFMGLIRFGSVSRPRGYAVLLPKFRASTGSAKNSSTGKQRWDKSQDDLPGAKISNRRGIADPKRIGIMGGSYGGYATLAGVTFTPDMYAAAVSIVGPSNLITLLESIPPYWEQIRKLFYERMGDPNTPEGKAQLLRQSPLTHADKIKTPLLVVQGANDPRVTKRESDQIVIAFARSCFPVEYIVAPDEDTAGPTRQQHGNVCNC